VLLLEQQQEVATFFDGVDAQGQIVASAVTESSEQDPSQVPALLSQVDRVIARFIGACMTRSPCTPL
jgi:hypothetical protein